MFYIVVALKSEAQAFVDKYKLTKSKLRGFTLYQDENMILIISGIGVGASRDATQTIIDYFDITDDDVYINIGICAANNTYTIGELIEIGSVTYSNTVYNFKDAKALLCLDKESSDNSNSIVDMESYGFYDAIIHSPAIKHFYILKVVSDHFEPHTITKEKTKHLIFNQIDVINKTIFKKEVL